MSESELGTSEAVNAGAARKSHALTALESGRTWRAIRPDEATPVGKPGVNERIWVCDVSDAGCIAHFKYPSNDELTSLYSIGFERVAFSLATILGLPVPDTHLEEFEGKLGVLTFRLPGRPWTDYEADINDATPTFLDRDRWPLYVAFDILLANPDRHSGNVYVEWDPPSSANHEGEVCTTWLIDYGFGGLFPARKFGATTLEEVDPRADLTNAYVQHLRNQLLIEYRKGFVAADRPAVVDAVRKITEDDVCGAVSQVPDVYMSATVANLTIDLLVSRLRRIDTLINDVFPP